MSDLNIYTLPATTSKLLIQLMNFSDLHSETPNLVPKNLYMIHLLRIAYPDGFQQDCSKKQVPASIKVRNHNTELNFGGSKVTAILAPEEADCFGVHHLSS